VLSADGALCADTGDFTGRSPKDKFTVRDGLTDKSCGGPATSRSRGPVRSAVPGLPQAAEGMTLFAQDLYGGADPTHRIKTRSSPNSPGHSLFNPHASDPSEASELPGFVPELTIVDLPSFAPIPNAMACASENVVAIDFARKIVLIGGSYYAGEMKKSVFTTLNYYLPEKGVMPMHCSAMSARRRHRDLLSASPAPARRRSRPTEAHFDRRRRAWLGK